MIISPKGLSAVQASSLQPVGHNPGCEGEKRFTQQGRPARFTSQKGAQEMEGSVRAWLRTDGGGPLQGLRPCGHDLLTGSRCQTYRGVRRAGRRISRAGKRAHAVGGAKSVKLPRERTLWRTARSQPVLLRSSARRSTYSSRSEEGGARK